jgi:hypothetical protein
MNIKQKQDIYSTINPSLIHRELDAYPERIANQKSIVRNAKRTFDNADLDRAQRENELLAIITSETESATGKAKYSNKESRDAELKKRCRIDAEYKAATQKSQEAENAWQQEVDKLEQLQDKYKSMRYRAKLAGDELEFWAGEETEEEEQVQGSKQAY